MSVCARDVISTLPKLVGAAKPYLGQEEGRLRAPKVIAISIERGPNLHRRPWPGSPHGSLQNSATPKKPLRSPVQMP